MGCFPVAKNKSKVASHQADQNNGPKLEHLLPSSKPVMLPDLDNLTGEQSQGPGSVSATSSLRGFVKAGQEGGSSTITLSTGNYNSSASSRLIHHHPRALSAPVNYHFPGDDSLASSGCAPPFSAPLSSSRAALDGSPPLHVAAPTANDGSSLCCAGVGMSEVKPRTADKRMTSTSSFKETRTAFGGQPLRLPKPQPAASNGHPLPYPPELGQAVAANGLDCVAPSSNKGKTRRAGTSNYAFRAFSIGGANHGEAMPLPPPALPTESCTRLRAFPYSELAHSFVPECFLGDGVFGSAYRTWVLDRDDGENKMKMEVAVVCPAVKAHQGLREWMAEVNWLARLHDPNLCKLIGYCAEDVPGLGSKRLLVYEYMCNGSLDKYMKGKESIRQLDWSTRMRVALDVAQGLAYLHDKAPFQVICRDLSSPSIQLEKDLRAKLSGFGLARSGPEGDQGLPMAGTYVAPESGSNGLVTIKSNAWSFGVVLLELITGRRHMDPRFPSCQRNLVQLTKPFLRDEGKLFVIMDPELQGKYSVRGALKVANLACQCLIKEASLRPNLSEAVDVLKTVQIDEEGLANDLKKSRSLTKPIGSPLGFSRSTSDPFVQRGEQRGNSNSMGNSVTLCLSSDHKQRDHNFLKVALLGLPMSSPSYVESRLSNGYKHPKSSFSDREAQKLPAPVPTLESRNYININQQREWKPPKLTSIPLVETISVQLGKTMQHGGSRKVSASHDISSLSPSSNDVTRSGSPVRSQSREGKRLLSPNPAADIWQLGDIKQQSQAQKLLSLAGPYEAVQSDDIKDQGPEVKKLLTPHITGSIQHNEIRQRSLEVRNLPTPHLTSLVTSGGEINLQHQLEAGKPMRSLPHSGEFQLPQLPDFGKPIRSLPHSGEIKLYPDSDVSESTYSINYWQQLSDGRQQDMDASKQLIVTLKSNVEPNETKKEECESQKSSSAPSLAISRVSCAPSLTFEPPVHREAF